VQRVEQPSASNSNAAKSAIAQCTGTQKVINASGYVTDGSTKVLLDQVTPSPDLTEVTVAAKETDVYTANWTVTAVATCADPPSGLTRTEQIGLANDSTSPKTTTVGCADSTQIVLGTGFDIVGGAGLHLGDAARADRCGRQCGQSILTLLDEVDQGAQPDRMLAGTAGALCRLDELARGATALDRECRSRLGSPDRAHPPLDDSVQRRRGIGAAHHMVPSAELLGRQHARVEGGKRRLHALRDPLGVVARCRKVVPETSAQVGAI
jgi:hypothetical protein